MRGPQLPIGAIACVSSALGLLSAASGLECVSDRFPSLRAPVPQLTFPWSCRADASGYDAMDSVSAPPVSASSELYSPDSSGTCNDSTGVFHQLHPAHAKLLLVQVVFRHGARTPLSSRSDMWKGQQWDVCGEAYQAAAVRLFSTAGVEDPVSKHDVRQRSTILDGGCRKGELTLLGQSQALDLGRWLRSSYVAVEGFLPPTHQEGVVEARTTNVSRTIASLRGVLTGLYPDLPRQPGEHHHREGRGTQQQPPQQQQVPRVTTSGDLDEILYADTRACPHLGSFQAISREAGKASVRSDPDYEWARGELLRLLDLDPVAFDSDRWIFTDVHDVLTSMVTHGKVLPPGFSGNTRLLTVINRLATKEFGAEVAPSVRDSHGRTVLRLSIGRLLHIVVENMQQAAAAAAAAVGKGKEEGFVTDTAAGAASAMTVPKEGARPQHPKMYLYSGHDSTIMPLLSALGLDVTEWPPYLSNLVLELWQLPLQKPDAAPRYVVRVLYNQQELPLPHCPAGFLPSLQTFKREVVGPFLLSAQYYQELCRVKVEHDGAMPQPKAKAATA